ncbi:F-box/kelch-repeat protein [Dissostichus eleginoides]|uniref:F-box/kelch-repeat protein n=1 Tax=Dissostichus eleginoides TaxID=100907 RepID=A0AAD9BPD3_DISEL|nr:F-box/kelch-repeat protein [Dissostichus eleginoides]
MILGEVAASRPTRSRSLSSGCAEMERKLDPPKFPLEKCQRNTFPRRSASSDIPEYLLPPHPSKRNSQHPPCPTPSTFLLLLALEQMVLSL